MRLYLSSLSRRMEFVQFQSRPTGPASTLITSCPTAVATLSNPPRSHRLHCVKHIAVFAVRRQSQVDRFSDSISKQEWASAVPLVMPLLRYPSRVRRFSDVKCSQCSTRISCSCGESDDVNFSRPLQGSPPTLDVKEITKNAAGDPQHFL